MSGRERSVDLKDRGITPHGQAANRGVGRSDEMRTTALAATVVVAALLSVVSTASASKRDPACSATPGSVTAGQSYTVSAHGLPGGNVNLVVTVPGGTTMTSLIDSSNGNWSGAYTAPESGTYTYMFVGKVTWPAGTYNQVYATCSAQVS
jgi:hypothetical protein